MRDWTRKNLGLMMHSVLIVRVINRQVVAGMLNDRVGRRASVVHQAGIRVERPFEGQLSDKEQLLLLADCVNSRLSPH